jgi:AcrR family transcriptional regulator
MSRKTDRPGSVAGPASTRERLVAAGIELFQRQGMAATGIKQILSLADARFSSLYHHFPGGKDELAGEVIRSAGVGYQRRVEEVWDQAADPVAAMRAVFEGAAAVLKLSDYADVCPVGTVAMEVASTNEPLRQATADVYRSWLQAGQARFSAAGVDPEEARQLSLTVVVLLEGAFMLCRAGRSTEPMLAAGEMAARLVSGALRGIAPGNPPSSAEVPPPV